MNYMLIDVTEISAIGILKIAPLREIQLWGKIFQADGRKVIAPPVQGRGFSKLEKLQLQYLYYGLKKDGSAPPDDFGDLVTKCFELVSTIPVDPTPLKALEKQVDKLYPDGTSVPSSHQKEPKVSKAKDPLERPKATSTTGLVWEICDTLFAKTNAIPGRKDAIEACVAEEINPATASTQYAKWKASKTKALGS